MSRRLLWSNEKLGVDGNSVIKLSPDRHEDKMNLGTVSYSRGFRKWIVEDIKTVQKDIHKLNVQAGWWSDLKTGEPKERNMGELLCLVHSEISEAMEGYRKNLMDDKIPSRKMIEVELADAIIRMFDIAGKLDLDLGGAIYDKIEYNYSRADHKIENRLKDGGKKF